MTTAKKRKPHKQVMWAMFNNDNPDCPYFVSGALNYTRRDCINEFLEDGFDLLEDGFWTWPALKKMGYRCVKVEVKEIV